MDYGLRGLMVYCEKDMMGVCVCVCECIIDVLATIACLYAVCTYVYTVEKDARLTLKPIEQDGRNHFGSEECPPFALKCWLAGRPAPSSCGQ